MPSRRNVLAFLGLAAVAAPTAIASAVTRPAGVDLGAMASGDATVDALTTGGLRAMLLRDLRCVTYAELVRAEGFFKAADIPLGSWIPLSAQGQGDA